MSPNCKGNNCEHMGFTSVNSSELAPWWELANSVHPRGQLLVDNPGTTPLPPGFKHSLLKCKHTKKSTRKIQAGWLLCQGQEQTCRGSYWPFS